MNINTSLLKTIADLEINFSTLSAVVLVDRLQELLDQGFRTSGKTGCVYFAGSDCEESSELQERLHDLSGMECFVNDVSIHVECEGQAVLIQGITFAERLARALSDFKKVNFKVILSFDDDSCTVRFHQVRQGENWIDDDIDSYEDGLAVIST